MAPARRHFETAGVRPVIGQLLSIAVIVLGARYLSTALQEAWWGIRLCRRFPFPDSVLRQAGITPDKGSRAVGARLLRISIAQVILWPAMMTGWFVYLLDHDTFRIGGEELRLFSDSTAPWLDIAKIAVVTTITVATYLNTKVALNVNKPGRWQGDTWYPRTPKSRRSGLTLVAGGTLLCVAVGVLCLALIIPFFLGRTDSVLAMIAPSVIIMSGPAYGVGLKFRRRGRRHLSPVISSLRETDDFPLVLYLRTFTEDAELDQAEERMGDPVLSHLLISGRSEEEQLARAVRSVGRLVAVGTPGETIPYSGAARMYLPPDNWQDPVREMMHKAELVVLTIGHGEGTLWEFFEAMRILPPRRLVLLVPFEEDEYENFRHRVRERAKNLPDPPSLPPYLRDPRVRTPRLRSRIRAVIYSRSDVRWEGEFVWLESETMQTSRFPEFRDKLFVALKYGLRPVLERIATERSEQKR